MENPKLLEITAISTSLLSLYFFSKKIPPQNLKLSDKEGILAIVLLLLSHSTCVQLCDLIDCSPPGSFVYGILQARILEWVVMPSSRGTSLATLADSKTHYLNLIFLSFCHNR